MLHVSRWRGSGLRFGLHRSRSLSTAPTLTLLHKTLAVLPHVERLTTSHEKWKLVLSRSYEDIQVKADKIRIGVFGLDAWTNPSSLVSALLQTEFATKQQVDAIQTRWDAKDGVNSLVISNIGGNNDVHTINSPWFDRFPTPVEITEYKNIVQPVEILPLFDLHIAVLSPFFFGGAEATPHFPNIVYAVWSAEPSSKTMDIVHTRLHGSEPVFVDPIRAIEAISSLNANPKSITNVSIYTRDALASGMTTLNKRLDAILAHPEGLAGIRLRAVHFRIREALHACKSSVERASSEQAGIRLSSDLLLGEVAKLNHEPLLPTDAVNVSMLKAETVLRAELDCVLGPWRVITHIDDVGDIVRRAVTRLWCRDLEHTLIFAAGTLHVQQKQLGESTTATLTSLPSSALLQNAVAQIASQPSHIIASEALTEPIYKRRDVLLAHPTTSLHLAAQHYIISLVSSLLGGGILSWYASYGSTIGLALGASYGVESGLAAGAFAALLGIRYSMHKWQKAKKRWWHDWRRVGEGLDRDLQQTINTILRDQVTAVPIFAANELERTTSHRSAELEVLRKELEALETDLDALQHVK